MKRTKLLTEIRKLIKKNKSELSVYPEYTTNVRINGLHPLSYYALMHDIEFEDAKGVFKTIGCEKKDFGSIMNLSIDELTSTYAGNRDEIEVSLEDKLLQPA